MTVLMKMLSPPELEGQYLLSFDFDAEGGKGYGEFTHNPYSAKQFVNNAEALLFWKRRSRIKPYRGDGKPNRPLTASTVELISL